MALEKYLVWYEIINKYKYLLRYISIGGLYMAISICVNLHSYFFMFIYVHKNIERHTAHTIVSWPNPTQWVVVHTSDLMMIIGQSMYIISIITKEMGELKTHSPTHCIMDNWENMLHREVNCMITSQLYNLITKPRGQGQAFEIWKVSYATFPWK